MATGEGSALLISSPGGCWTLSHCTEEEGIEVTDDEQESSTLREATEPARLRRSMRSESEYVSLQL